LRGALAPGRMVPAYFGLCLMTRRIGQRGRYLPSLVGDRRQYNADFRNAAERKRRPGASLCGSHRRCGIDQLIGSPTVESWWCQCGDNEQPSAAAPRAALVFRAATGGAGVGVVGCFGLVLGELEGVSGLPQSCGPATVGEQAVVTDPHQPLGQHMEEESAHQLGAVEPGCLFSSGVPIVGVAQSNLALIDGDEPPVAKGDAVAVAGQIADHLLGVTETMSSGRQEPRLRERVREVIRTRRYRHRTEKSCWYWIRYFIRFHELLGHADPRTTQIYTHVPGQRFAGVRSPLA